MSTENLSLKKSFSFLQGGGEMGELTRNYPWESTEVGSPETWPQSLRTTLSILLNARFPMFLWWGSELIQFYNDAYRPSLGENGKHPTALGQRGEDCWPEIWPTIKPLIDQVLSGGNATWSEDHLIPIFRNGQLEDVYWTFSYNPVNDEAGKVGGVLVVCHETTKNVQTVKELKISEARFLNLIREAPVGIIVLSGKEMLVELVNKAYCKLIDRTPEELTGKPYFDIVPEAEEVYRPFLEDVLLNGKEVSFNGHPYTVESNGKKIEGCLDMVFQPFKEYDGAITGVMALCHDVTEQVRSRKKIEESEQRLRSFIESAPFPISVYTGKEMLIQFANQSIMNAWGKGNDVIGKLYTDILPELENQEIFNQVQQVYNTGIPFHAKDQRVDLVVDGKLQPYYFNYSFTPVFDGDGNIYGVMNTAADVSDLHLAHKKMEESEQNLRNVILQAPVAMCILKGADYVVEIANERMYEIWGKSKSEIYGKPIFQGLPEAKGQGLEDLLNSVYTTGKTFIAHEIPVSLPRTNGIETVYLDFVYEAFREGNNEVSGIMAVAIEVTDQIIARRKIEESEALLQARVEVRTEELKKANEDLANINKELEQFTYAASHDMQEPLRKVHTFSSFLLHNNAEQLDDRGKNYLNKIASSVDRMKNIIDDLLYYSHQTREEQIFESTDLNKIIEEIKADMELNIQQNDATVETITLPLIKAVPSQMNQLFSNLFSNSLKFSKPGEPLKIKIDYKILSNQEVARLNIPDPHDQYIKIIFSDNGIGFEQQYAQQIFRLFTRLHGKAEYAGTGIGLGLCKKIVQNHNGLIWAESEPGKGADFIIVLPLLQ